MAEEFPPGTKGAIAIGSHSAVPHVITPPAGNLSFNGLPPLVLLRQAWENLFEYARTQAAAGHHQFAVLFAHAACELQIEGALNQLLNARNDKVLVKLIAPADRDVMSLDNSRVYRVYAALTDDHPKVSDWWDQWKESRQNRHDVAHRGSAMTVQQSTLALTVAEKHFAHVSKAVAAALTKLAPNSP